MEVVIGTSEARNLIVDPATGADLLRILQGRRGLGMG